MKIAVITNSYRVPTELWLWRQVEYMKENIGYVGVFDRIKECKDTGYSVESLAENEPQIALNPFFLIRKLLKLEKQYEIDIYYIHYLTNAFILKEFISFSNKKIFVHCHGYDLTFDLKQHQNPLINFHSQSYIEFSKNLPDNIVYITDSKHAKNLLINQGVSNERVKVLYFGVPVEGINQYKVISPLKILYLGRLVDFKGPDLTIQAFDMACVNGLDAELYVVGDGPLMVTCQLLKQRSRFGNRIKLLGTLPYEAAKKLRAECHIFTAHNIKGILTNQQEAYGVSIVEAMSAGLPVVTGSDGGVVETVINNETGYLFNPGDVESHSKFLMKLGSIINLRKKLGEKAFNLVKSNFSLEKEEGSLLKILNIEKKTKINKKRACIIGPYRYHNFGDDLIGVVIAKSLQSKGYDVCFPKLGKENANWLDLEFNENYEEAVKSAELIILGGGGLFGDAGINPDDFYRELSLKAATLAKSQGKRIITTGVGAGPLELKSSELLTQQIAELSETIGLRDEESEKFLGNLKVDGHKLVRGADIALLCSDYIDFDKSQSTKIGFQFDIGSYQDILKGNPDIFNIYRCIGKYVTLNSSNIVLISNGNFKSQLYKEFGQNCEILCYSELEKFLPVLAGLKAIFTSHLHLAITAYSLRIPCFSLYVREKTKRFYNQIGHPERAIDLKHAEVEFFYKLIDDLENSKWTDKDETCLAKLKKEAQSLLDII